MTPGGAAPSDARRDAARTGAEAPLVALHAVALDTEATGLDVRTERLVQIGAVRMTGAELLKDDRFDSLLAPGIPVPQVATRIHKLTDADLAGAPDFAEVGPRLLDWLGDAVVIGHSIHFDLALMRFEAARRGLAWREPRALDVGLLAAALEPARVDVSLDALAVSFGVTITGRHSALGDAEAAARVFAALLPRLLAAGVRTLGEAESFARRPGARIEQQDRAGWFARPDDGPDFTGAAIQHGARRAIDSFIYRHRVDEVMGAPPITADPDETLGEAALRMIEHRIGCLIVTPTPEGAGIVTERDVLHALARNGAGAAALRVGDVMTSPVISAPRETLLYRVLGRMARRNLRYIAVTGADGAVCGVFTLRTMLRERALDALTVGDEIAEATRPRHLARAQAALPGLAASLLADGLDARDVAAVIAAEGRAMTARAAELAEAAMLVEGFGPAPAAYCVLVLGSGGRGESLLAPDQDNAVVIADDYAGDLDAADDWFAEWSARMNAILDRAGVPFCKGGVMAKNRAWRKRLGEWRETLEGWARAPNPETLLNVDIFHDFAPVHGDPRLAQVLRQAATQTAQGARGLIRALGEQAGSHRPPVGLFGRLKRDDAGRVDLKAGGLLPITAGARVMALRRGVPALSTPERLKGAAERAGAGQRDAEVLTDIHRFLLRLILTQQIADIEAGERPSNRIDPKRLSPEDADRLAEAFKRLDLMQEMVRDVLQGL